MIPNSGIDTLESNLSILLINCNTYHILYILDPRLGSVTQLFVTKITEFFPVCPPAVVFNNLQQNQICKFQFNWNSSEWKYDRKYLYAPIPPHFLWKEKGKSGKRMKMVLKSLKELYVEKVS